MPNFDPQVESSGESKDKPEKANLDTETAGEVPESVVGEKSQAGQERPFEIHNLEQIDVVKSTGSDINIEDLAKDFSGHEPDGWSENQWQGRHWTSPDGEFFAKKKRSIRNYFDEDSENSSVDFTREHYGIMNEFSVMSKVENVINKKEVQDLVKEYGFKSINFVKPELGIINNENGTRFMIYKNIDGTGFLTAMVDLEDYPDMPPGDVIELTKKIKNFLKDNGIQPRDLSHNQLVVSTGEKDEMPKLYLTDIEAFRDKDKYSSIMD